MRTTPGYLVGMSGAAALLAVLAAQAPTATGQVGPQDGARAPQPAAAHIDPYVPRQRLLVLTDIANEPDDQMSMVRLLVYSDGFDIEGLVATTSTWMKQTVRPDVIRLLIDAYEQVQPNLLTHSGGFPLAATLRDAVSTGQPGYGMAAVGPGKETPGSASILRAMARQDSRPLWITVWGGANTLAQALVDLRATRTAADIGPMISTLRVYSISDQDDAGPWIRREFPTLHYIAMPSPPNGEQYSYATWTGISGDRFYRNASGADFTTFTEEWVNTRIRARGPLGAHYPSPCCIYEGDTPSFLGLIDNGLASAMSPSFGGWGGRYVWRQFYGEPRPFWTQGGDSYPGNSNSQDTVIGTDGTPRTSDQATIWRWRQAFQHDFAARMDWTVRDLSEANHNPEAVVNGGRGKAPLALDAQVGVPVTLDAAGTADRDGDTLTYRWFFYPEAGSGVPGHPVFAGSPWPGGPPAADGGPPELPPRVVLQNATTRTVTVLPMIAGVAHVILAVEDDGVPSLTAYRRVILTIRAAPSSAP
jgi:hypothetical protein